MKRLNYLLVCVLSIFLLTACNKDVNHDDGGNSGDLFATFSVKTGDSRANATKTGQSEENTLTSVYIYMFDETNILSSNGKISMNGTTGTSTLATSLGEKTVYALINGEGNIALPIVENGVTTLDAFKKSLKQTGLLNDDKIAKSGDFLMFGFSKVNITEANHASASLAKKNPIIISANRVSSKVSFVFGSSVGKASLKGTFSDVKFAMNQTHTMVDISRELTSAGGTNYTPTSPNSASPYSHLHKLTDLTDDTHYKSSSTNNTEAGKFSNSHYCLENINATPVAGNSTFVLIKLKFKPQNGKTSESGDFSNNATTTTLAENGDFWTVTSPNASQGSPKELFATEAEANSIVADGQALAGGEVNTHASGHCYYRLNLRNTEFPKTQMTKRYAVLRNAHYRVNITSVTVVGESDPDKLIPDPETPLEKDEAYVTAEITILPWTVIEMEEELGS